MIVYRLCKKKHRNDLSGREAELGGGRWNSKGMAILYTSENRALCTAEIAVHTPLGIVPSEYYLITLELPKKTIIHQVFVKDLPKNWKKFPHIPETKTIGDDFIQENKYLVLKTPSAVIQEEYNYLINQNYRDFDKVKIKNIEPFEFDLRLFNR